MHHMNRIELDRLATRVLDAAFEVHRELGPGLLESVSEMALCHELSRAGIAFERQIQVPVSYKSIKLDCGFRLDGLVERSIVLELKSCQELQPIHEATLLNYLRLMDLRLGYLVNLNVKRLKSGIRRIANALEEDHKEAFAQ
jgi:GxxExxY protein